MNGILNTADIIIIIASLILVVVVGIVSGRKRDDTAGGYFLAGRKMPWWVIGCSFVATGISSEQIVGTVGITYQHGMGIANWEWFALPAYSLVLVIFIPIILRTKLRLYRNI